jgi:hypothetical protein
MNPVMLSLLTLRLDVDARIGNEEVTARQVNKQPSHFEGLEGRQAHKQPSHFERAEVAGAGMYCVTRQKLLC